ncbi:hypothetical protein CYJ10_12550 [Cupriavidus pauculus]|uniref:Fimbrial-type adhesion domain-containing protein n=2 Tax=Cupriavidus pauculus TaxID=82633 RepID=A0A2N5CE09_9BURK|nr:hypothetical protein CYJ10_12550 [Cupriavidus pauculus]
MGATAIVSLNPRNMLPQRNEPEGVDMNRRVISIIFGLALLIASQEALALRCVNAANGSAVVAGTISTNIPVPADAVDGAVIWESTPRTITVTCSHDWTSVAEDVFLYVNPTGSGPAAGTTVGIRWAGYLYTQTSGTIHLNERIPAGMGETVTFPFTFSVVVLKNGSSPTGGLSTFNNFRVFQMDGRSGLNITPGYNINYVLNGSVRFVECLANLNFQPSNLVDFGSIPAVGTAGNVAVEREFMITAARACESPYALHIAFVPTTSTPNGVVSNATMYALDNGVGISILDAALGTPVPLDGTYVAFVDLLNTASASKAYRARLTRRLGTLAAGVFSATMLVTVEYY